MIPENTDSVHSNETSTQKRLGGVTGKGFLPGQSGNPGGKSKKKPLTEVYERLLENPEFIEEVEKSIWKMVRDGRMVGQLQLKEMTERIEGKVSQPVEGEFTLVTISERMRKARERASGS